MESVVEDNSWDIETMLLCFADDDDNDSISSSEQVPEDVFSLTEIFTESLVENEMNDRNKNKNALNLSSSLGKRKERRENNVGEVVDEVMAALDDKQARLSAVIQTLNAGLEEGGELDQEFLSLDDHEGNLGFDRDSSHQTGILEDKSIEIPDLEDGLSYEEMLEILCSNDDEGDMSIDEFLLLLTDIRRFEGHD
ncbi:unnamed protein product [Dovyalis caffra]|uniref:Uncharacterized protein n=1 Tax=Dovyalis caffra TaxID=77055 RepID=A0AAV1R2J7_9ROSI|nr:unnamed protein product [Dovyalis caffra]